MHLFDVEDALDQADTRGLEHAFRVLIDYPHSGHVEGARLTAKLIGLFEHVTLALQLDQTAMPEKLCQRIESLTSVPIEAGASYAHGSIIASEFSDRWHRLFCDFADSSHAPATGLIHRRSADA